MAYANGTLHYNLPQTVGTDVRDWSDTNQAFEDVDTALFGAVSDVATASSKVNALDEELNDASTGVVAQLGQAQTDIIGLDGRVQTLEGTVANHTLQIADVRSDCEDMISAFNETSSTSTHNYAIGDYFRYNDVLYIATAVINIGDTIVPDTNCKTTNVTTELLDIKAGIVDKVGDLANLTTTDKDSCVAAINEVNNDLAQKSEYSLLWENANPTSNMAADTEITLSSSDYDFLLFVFDVNVTYAGTYNTQLLPKNSAYFNINNITMTSSGIDSRVRSFIKTSDTKLTGSWSKHYSTGGSVTDETNSCVPIKIYGLKI